MDGTTVSTLLILGFSAYTQIINGGQAFMFLTSLLAQSDAGLNYSYPTTDITTTNSAGLALFSGGLMLFWLAFAVIAIVGMWKVFQKASKPGWASIVPFYNSYVMVEIAGRPGWWFLLYFIPVANIVVSLLVAIDIAKAFGKSETFGVVALWLFSIVGFLMLGFGDAKYHGGTSAGPTAAPASTPPAAPAPPVAPSA